MRVQSMSVVVQGCREAARTRLPWLVAATVLGALGVAEFAAALALIDRTEYRLVIYAGTVRLALAIVMVLHVTSALVRDSDDGVLALVLSRPVSRPLWYASRLLGWAVIALIVALVALLPLLALGEAGAALAWGFGLYGELLLLVAAGAACAVGLRQVPAAVAATGAFYVLARSIGALELMSAQALVDPATLLDRALAGAISLLGLLLPDLGRFAAGAWLVGGAADGPALGGVAVQTAIYGALFLVIGMIDLSRQSP